MIETILQPKQNVLKPVLQLQAVVAEAPKIRHLDKRAYIDFPVNRIELRADYRRNPAQLDSIITTINALKADKNLQVMGINIHGFASPEGSYKHNEYLAKNRAITLTEYVRKWWICLTASLRYHLPLRIGTVCVSISGQATWRKRSSFLR